MSENPSAEPAQVVTIMTTEHFTLQTARSGTISDANGRSSLYLSSVSGVLVALAFVGQVSNLGTAFYLFSLVLFPSLFFLGLVTFVRVLQTAIEDMVYARGINRIRHYYTEVAPQLKKYFILSTSDDMLGMQRNMGSIIPRFQLYFTNAGMIAVINSVIGGVFFGLLLAFFFSTLPAWVYILVGAVILAISVALHQRFQEMQWTKAYKSYPVVFPGEQNV